MRHRRLKGWTWLLHSMDPVVLYRGFELSSPHPPPSKMNFWLIIETMLGQCYLCFNAEQTPDHERSVVCGR